jgi:hypothetical protein
MTKHSQKTAGLAHRFKPAIAQMKTAPDAVMKTSPNTPPPVYRPQPTPRVLQKKSKDQSSASQANRIPVALPVYRPQTSPGVLQAKSIARTINSARHVPSSAPIHSSRAPLIVANSKSGIQLKGRPSRVIQRAELPAEEEKKVNLRYAVVLKVSLNGKDIGAYMSKTSRYGAASEHDHAEDGIVHAIQAVLGALERSGGRLTDQMTAFDIAIAKSLRFDTVNVLRIYGLTASPCTSSTKKKKTSNKGAGEGCAELLIDLAGSSLDLMIADQVLIPKFKIQVEADHYYQPGANGEERALSREASEEAVERMEKAGITVKIG